MVGDYQTLSPKYTQISDQSRLTIDLMLQPIQWGYIWLSSPPLMGGATTSVLFEHYSIFTVRHYICKRN
jgi:hypothetical protein